jgi:hypothetical protein
VRAVAQKNRILKFACSQKDVDYCALKRVARATVATTRQTAVANGQKLRAREAETLIMLFHSKAAMGRASAAKEKVVKRVFMALELERLHPPMTRGLALLVPWVKH